MTVYIDLENKVFNINCIPLINDVYTPVWSIRVTKLKKFYLYTLIMYDIPEYKTVV